MDGNLPLVTVCTLIYNTNPRYVIEAIESIRANNYPNLQHIIIDDCSPDPTPKEVVKQWIQDNKYPCEFYEHEVNYGVCKTLNHVLELAKGKYYFGCSDDLVKPDKLFRQVQLFESLSPEYALLYSDTEMIDSKGNNIGSIFSTFRKLDTGPEGYILEDLFLGNFIHFSGALIKTQCHDIIGGFNEDLIVEDIDMCLRISQKFKIKFDEKPSAIYRIHDKGLLSTLKTKGLEQNLLSLSPFYKYSKKTEQHYIGYLSYCNNIFHQSDYINWKMWFKKRWQVRKNMQGFVSLTKSLLNITYSKERILIDSFLKIKSVIKSTINLKNLSSKKKTV